MIQKILVWCAATALVLGLLVSTLLEPHANADTEAGYNAEHTYAQSSAAVLYIRALRSDGTVLAVGSGVILKPDGTAATAYHVVKGAASLEAILQDGRSVGAVKLISYDEFTDAALIKLPAAKFVNGKPGTYTSLVVRPAPVKHGETVYAIGYPMKDTMIITEGIVNTPAAEINGRSRILTSAQIASGMSGGPVLDSNGRIVGVISGSMRTMSNIHLLINMEQLHAILPE